MLYANEGYEDFKILNNGGWRSLIINWWLRHNGAVDLKMGGWGGGGEGGVILSKLILVPQKILNKSSTFWPNAPKILSNCIPELPWQNWHKIHFLLHFHACCFSNNSFEWISFFMCCIYILSFKLFKIRQVSSLKSLIEFLSFSSLWIINNYKQFELQSVFC